MFSDISLLRQHDMCEIRLRRVMLCSDGSIPPELEAILDLPLFPGFSVEPQIFAVKLVMKPLYLRALLRCLFERQLINELSLKLARARIQVLWPDLEGNNMLAASSTSALTDEPGLEGFLQTVNHMLNKGRCTTASFQVMATCLFSGRHSRYQTLIKDGFDYHLQLLYRLLSTYTGLGILSELFNSGFSLYYPSMPREPIRRVIKNAGLALRQSAIDKSPFSDLFDRLQATFQHKMIGDLSELPLTCLVYNPFLCIFINNYVLDQQKKLSSNILKRQRHLVFRTLQLGQFESVETLFPVMKFCGLSFRYIDTIMDFLVQNFPSNEARIWAYLFIFERFGEELFDEEARPAYDWISVRCARAWILAGCSLNERQITLELDKHCEEYFSQFPVRQKRRKELRAFAEHGFLQLAALMAKYLNQQAGMPVILSLARQCKPCYRMVVYDNQVEYWDARFIKPEGYVNTNHVTPTVIPPGEWQATIKAIQSTFHHVEQFETGLRHLEAELATVLPVLTPIAACCEQEQLRLYELSIPSRAAFLWWKELPSEQRKMNRALHQALLTIEQRAGYTDVDEHDGITRFWGFVPRGIADQLIRSGGRFAESSRSMAGIVHGPAAHRIQLAVIFILIQENKIPMPDGKRMIDLLRFIVDSRLWSRLLDSNLTRFSFPHFMMAWLRNATHLPCLRQAALFSYFNAVDKYLWRYQLCDYESVVYSQICHDWMFYPESLDDSLISDVKERRDVIGLTVGKDYFFYHKARKHDKERPHSEQAMSSSPSGGL